ncbi:MAG: zinc ribbon domain-containing protein YjdM [Pseudobdellovibrionaceae bacterium]
MAAESKCPKCESENIYQDGNLWICPECTHEWSLYKADTVQTPSDSSTAGVRDANGNILQDGDSVVVIKDLKIKGASSVIKGGTKVRNIRLSDAGDGHDISCKIDGLGAINLKSEFVKKV